FKSQISNASSLYFFCFLPERPLVAAKSWSCCFESLSKPWFFLKSLPGSCSAMANKRLCFSLDAGTLISPSSQRIGCHHAQNHRPERREEFDQKGHQDKGT